jgi:hypothetical protein
MKGNNIMGDIKTKNTLKDIKVLDKSIDTSARMKNAFIRTKDEEQHSQQVDHNSPSKYATDSTTCGAENVAYKTGNQVKRQTGKIIDKAKKSRNVKRATEKTIKTAPKVEKTIKQSAKATGKSVKTTAKGTIKTAYKSIKTTEKTAKTTFKTSQQTASYGKSNKVGDTVSTSSS